MAYQNVGTPRFFIDHLLWLKTLGLGYATTSYDGIMTPLGDFIGLNPTNPQLINVGGYDVPWGAYVTFHAAPAIMTANNKWKAYTAILGHNSALADAKIIVGGAEDGGIIEGDPSEYINFSPDSAAPYNGFTLCYDLPNSGSQIQFKFDPVDTSSGYFTNFNIGCLSHGNYYDMPHSADLKLTMTREMDGVKRIRTKGGVDLVNHNYIKPAMWGSAAPWELYQGTPNNQGLSRIGRRTWDLNFNYLSDSDVFPDTSSLTNYETTDPDGNLYSDENDENNITEDTLLDDDTFFSQVIHKTNGGQLPFIFQPDTNDNTQFSICKFDMNSFAFKQVANGVYNMKLKIREVW